MSWYVEYMASKLEVDTKPNEECEHEFEGEAVCQKCGTSWTEHNADNYQED